MKMKNIFLTIMLLLGCAGLFSQTTSNGLTVTGVHPQSHPAVKVVHSIVGEGVKLAGFSTNQPETSEAFGTFSCANSSLGMNEGLIMTSGSVEAALGPNTSTGTTGMLQIGLDTTDLKSGTLNLTLDTSGSQRDPDLEKLVDGMPTYDACVIELDVVPYGDTLAYNYLFASEEYDEYVGTPYNDVFAFFISGPGIHGAKNIAVLPGTDTPVAINNVNDGNPILGDSFPSVNPTFYVRNTSNTSLEYDGYTRLFQVRQAVVPGETYHLKLAISDVSDPILDSGVLIEAQSLMSYYANHQVHFETGGYEVSASMENELVDMLQDFQTSPATRLLISGHTDAVGSESSNLALSQKRVNGVKAWFVDHGVDAKQIVVDARGEAMPIASNLTKKGKEKNRRVEVKFLGGVDGGVL